MYCIRLTALGHKLGTLPKNWHVRLPTEAQWEYACRAGTTTATAFGDSLSALDANIDGSQPYNGGPQVDSPVEPAEVGKYKPNAWGIFDLHGNVLEWCRDWYVPKLPGGIDPQVTEPAEQRVLRGGSWFTPGVSARSAARISQMPDRNSNTPRTHTGLGFRIVVVRE